MSSFFQELLLRCGILLPDHEVPAELLFQSSSRIDDYARGPTISSSSSSSGAATGPVSADSHLITCTDNAMKSMRWIERELRQTPHKIKVYLRGLEDFLSDLKLLFVFLSRKFSFLRFYNFPGCHDNQGDLM